MPQIIECEICLEEYQQETFEEHREICKARLMFRCIVCDGNYVSKEGLWNHLDLHEIADESKELHYHQITATYKLHQCTLCNDQCGYQENLYWKHVHEVHDSFLQRCSDCGENFQSQKLKADHDLTHCKAKEQTVTSDLDSYRQFNNIVLPMQDENTASLVSCEKRHENSAVKLEPLQEELSCVTLEDNKCSGINTVDHKRYEYIDIDSRLIEFSLGNDTDKNMTEKESEVISFPRSKMRSEIDADQITLKMEITVEETTLLHQNDFEISTPNQSTITDCPDVGQHSKDQKVNNSELPLAEFSGKDEKESDVIPILSTKNMSETDIDQITLKMEIKVEGTTLLHHNNFELSTPNQSTISDCPDVSQHSEDQQVKNSELSSVEFSGQDEKATDVIPIPSKTNMNETDTDQISLKMEITVEETTLQHDEFCSISTPNQSTITGCPDVGQHSKDLKTYLRRNKKQLLPATRRTRRMVDVDAHLKPDLNSTDCLPCSSSDRYRVTSDQNVEKTSNQRPSTSREGTIRSRSLRRTRSNPQPAGDISTSSEASDFSIDESSWEASEYSSEQSSREASPPRKQMKEDPSNCLTSSSSDRYQAVSEQPAEITSDQRPSTSRQEEMRSQTLRRTRSRLPPMDHTGTSSEKSSRKASPPRKQMMEDPSKTLHSHAGFKCPDCGKRFNSQYHLRLHMAVHLKAKQKRMSKSFEILKQKPKSSLKKPRGCSICGLIFSGSRSNLTYHKLTAHTEPTFKCSQCPKMFHTNDKQRRHEATHCKTLEKNVVCSLCPKTFQNADNLKLHVRAYHPPSELPCSMCDLKFSTRPKLEYHVETLHADFGFKCTDCGKLFRREFFLRRHMAVHLKKKQKRISKYKKAKQQIGDDMEQNQKSKACSICGLIILGNMTYHQRTAHTKPRYKCSHCAKMFYYNCHLKLHEKSTHSKTPEKDKVCSLCPKTFRSAYNLEKHVYLAHSSSKLPCDMCALKFSTRHQLGYHMRKVHAEFKHKCSHCSKIFLSNHDLNRHEKSTHEKDEVCSLCLKTFRGKFLLQKHVRSAHPPSELPCNMCALKFSTHNKLWSHKLKVHDEKNVVCKLCPRTFADKIKLKAHGFYAHPSVESPCSMCDLKFSNRKKLLYHMLKVHDEKNVACKMCPRTFGDKIKLRNHVRSAHPSVESPCSMCDLKFSNRQKLLYHMKMIHNPRFKCPECFKVFHAQYVLRKHMEVHSKVTEKQHSSDGSKRRRLKIKGEKPPSDGSTRRSSKGKRKRPSLDDSYVVGKREKIKMPTSELRRSNRMRTKQ